MRKMEGERILKSLLNGETDNLFEDTKVCECSSVSNFWAVEVYIHVTITRNAIYTAN